MRRDELVILPNPTTPTLAGVWGFMLTAPDPLTRRTTNQAALGAQVTGAEWPVLAEVTYADGERATLAVDPGDVVSSGRLMREVRFSTVSHAADYVATVMETAQDFLMVASPLARSREVRQQRVTGGAGLVAVSQRFRAPSWAAGAVVSLLYKAVGAGNRLGDALGVSPSVYIDERWPLTLDDANATTVVVLNAAAIAPGVKAGTMHRIAMLGTDARASEAGMAEPAAPLRSPYLPPMFTVNVQGGGAAAFDFDLVTLVDYVRC
jgi:hypothetical protein